MMMKKRIRKETSGYAFLNLKKPELKEKNRKR